MISEVRFKMPKVMGSYVVRVLAAVGFHESLSNFCLIAISFLLLYRSRFLFEKTDDDNGSYTLTPLCDVNYRISLISCLSQLIQVSCDSPNWFIRLLST